MRGAAAVWRDMWRRFRLIHGPERAAAFGFYALFSLVPLVVLLVSAVSRFLDPARVRSVIDEVALRDESQRRLVWDMVGSLEHARGGVSLVSTLLLFWSASRFFSVLVGSVNRAWDAGDVPWWRSTLHNLAVLVGAGGAVLLGMVLPAVLHVVRQVRLAVLSHLPTPDWLARLDLTRHVTAMLLLWTGALILYGPAADTGARFRTVWRPALLVAVVLLVLQNLMVTQAPRLFRYHEIYGSVGGMMLLLIWLLPKLFRGIRLVLGRLFEQVGPGPW